MRSRPPCLAWREQLALRHEDLSDAEQQALDAHVQSCKTCAAALADYHFFEARLDALPPSAIMPLPRLSPHFFDQVERPQEHQHTQVARTLSTPARARYTRPPRPRAGARTVGRVLSVVAVICLLLAASLLFHSVYQARLASHPGGDTLLNLNQNTGAVMGVSWSPDGKYIATASDDHTVKVWNAQSGALVCTYTGHSDEVYALAWSPNGKFIASGGGDNTIQVWDPLQCSSPLLTYSGHTSAVMAVAWSPDGREIISGGWDHTTQIWSIATDKTVLTLPFSDTVSSVAWSRDGKEIAIGNWNGSVQVLDWNTTTKTWEQWHFYRDSNAVGAVNALAWSPNGEYLAAGNDDGTVEVRNVNLSGDVITQAYSGHTDRVDAVAWSPNGNYLASGSDDKTVRVWNPATGKTLMVYTGHTNTVSSLAWSPDGKEIASGSFDFTAKVWKVAG